MSSSDLASGSTSLSQIVEGMTLHYVEYVNSYCVFTAAKISDTSYPATPPVQIINESLLKLTKLMLSLTSQKFANGLLYCRISDNDKDQLYLLESNNKEPNSK